MSRISMETASRVVAARGMGREEGLSTGFSYGILKWIPTRQRWQVHNIVTVPNVTAVCTLKQLKRKLLCSMHFGIKKH